jgi:hypothetical protein
MVISSDDNSVEALCLLPIPNWTDPTASFPRAGWRTTSTHGRIGVHGGPSKDRDSYRLMPRSAHAAISAARMLQPGRAVRDTGPYKW